MSVTLAPDISNTHTAGWSLAPSAVRYRLGEWDHEAPFTVKGDILHAPGAYPWLSQIADAVRAADAWRKPTVIRGEEISYDEETRNCRIATLEAVPALVHIRNVLRTLEGMWIRAYQESVNSHACADRAMAYDVLEYTAGHYFREHVDFVQGNGDLSQRMLSFVALCGDSEGGELTFPRQDVEIEARGGDVVVFPAGITHPHEASEVISGTKYSLVTWFA